MLSSDGPIANVHINTYNNIDDDDILQTYRTLTSNDIANNIINNDAQPKSLSDANTMNANTIKSSDNTHSQTSHAASYQYAEASAQAHDDHNVESE